MQLRPDIPNTQFFKTFFYYVAEELSEWPKLRQEDSLVVCVLTKFLLDTGSYGLVFVGPGGEQVPLSQMVELFCGTNCKALAQKPKIFFFLAEQVDQNITDNPVGLSMVFIILFVFI